MVQHFLEYVRKSPTAFHAAKEASALLDAAGFVRLPETEDWALEPGRGYYLMRNDSALIAFRMPATRAEHFQIVAAHTDSPMFKIKPNSLETANGYARLNVECYGGAIYSTWLDRPLSIAGRLIVREDNRLRSVLTDSGRECALIPNMPIHFNREVNKGYAFNAQVDMLPLVGSSGMGEGWMEMLCDEAHVDKQTVVGHDLFLCCHEPGFVWGREDEYFSCPRIDDLACAWSAVCALIGCESPRSIAIAALLDNEEVGSSSRQGADGTMLGDAMARIFAALGRSDAEYRSAVTRSFAVSADNAHALHPNHPEKFDADNRVLMNGGVVIKHAANQKYASDGLSSAVFEQICASAGVPVQHFTNRSDIPGGSTLGNIANTHHSMCMVDIGMAQLAMHSCMETAGSRDLAYMEKAMLAFLRSDLHLDDEGCVIG